MTPYVVYISLQSIKCLERKPWLRNGSSVCVNVCSDVSGRERQKKKNSLNAKECGGKLWHSEQRRTWGDTDWCHSSVQPILESSHSDIHQSNFCKSKHFCKAFPYIHLRLWIKKKKGKDEKVGGQKNCPEKGREKPKIWLCSTTTIRYFLQRKSVLNLRHNAN